MQHAKKLSIFSLMCILILSGFTGCGKEETILDLTIIEQPQGGTNVHSVICAFEGEIVSGDKSVEVVAEWWWEDVYGSNDQIIQTEYYEFDSPQPISHHTSYDAGPLYVLAGYFWVEFSWTDDDGQHRRSSQKAFCEVYE